MSTKNKPKKMKNNVQSRLPVKPIRRTSLAEEIIGQLKDLIEADQLAPGTKLPGERELAQLFAVSRASVREALRALSLLGIIENRQGNGTYLTDSADHWPREPFKILFSLKKNALFEIFEARKGMDGTAASLAARRRNQEDLQAMEKALDGMAGHMSDPGAYILYELEFHRAVIEAAKNQVIASLTDTLYRLLQETRDRFQMVVESPDENRAWDYRNHVRVFERIKQKDEAGAYNSMINHLTEFEKYLVKKHGRPMEFADVKER
jgi:GntR family transcriptional repressor for pyruvate dehydrogenase complex